MSPPVNAATSSMHADIDPLSLQVNYHALLSASPDTVLLFDIDSGRLIDVNPKACSQFGLSERELLARRLIDLCPPVQRDGTPSQQLMDHFIARVCNGVLQVFEAEFVHNSGRLIECELRLVIMPTPSGRLMHVRLIDVTRRNQAEKLRKGQGQVLEMVARGAPLTATLDQLMLLIESQSDGVICSVMLLDDDGIKLRPGAAPTLPASYMALLDGVAIGPDVGSCGSAMFRKEAVIVSDISTDPLWAPYRALAAPYGLRACWSTPIYLDQQQVLGSFAMYYREVRSPDQDDMRLIEVATHLAGIAIERTRRERELNQHREHLEELVAARTAALTAALETLSLTQDELVRRDKLAALGALVAGVAHELNTPIGNSLVVATTMAEHVQQLADGVAGGLRRSTLENYLARAHEAGDLLVRNLHRAAKLVTTFKQLAVDRTTSQRRDFSVAELIEEVALPLRIAIRQRPVSVELSIAPALNAPTMDGYPGPLSQVLSNLFENCLVHAFAPDGHGTIRIAAWPVGEDQVSISVADDGAGIAPELADRVYDPFFTTRLGSGGSGLGLHVAHNIVSGVLGGHIALHSDVGRGSCFTLLLPRVAPDAKAPA
ncbi:ATP-binding protein [Massilia sp. TSP1-1-2]|uniref:PAS domain-containing sensor histidine kinase n=1 Tax=Massilia sp. TSP1-1-2 TaxID=2804649 RepID=UPI003CF1323B